MAKNNGCKIDYTTNTLIMNYKFRDAAEIYGSPEYKIVQAIKQDYPNIKICVKSGREQKKPKKNKRLTYKNMETYINCFENSDILINRFNKVKAMSLTMKSPYKYVSDWFVTQFPDYKKSPEFEENLTTPKIVPYPKKKDYEKKSDAV